MTPITFPREMTQKLKGVALILMIIHHTGMPEFWAEGSSESLVRWYCCLNSITKMCVYIFTFLIGYGFFCSRDKSLRYSFRRVLLLCIPFWTMLFFLFIPSAYASGRLASALNYSEGGVWLKGLVYNMFGISESLNWYSWFVCFYILTILSFPFIHKICSKLPRWGWAICIAGFYLAECVIYFIPNWNTNPLLNNLFVFVQQVSMAIMGYQCAAWNSEGKLPHWFEGRNRLPLALAAIAAVCVIKLMNISTKGFCLAALYTPILVFALVGIFNSFELKKLSKGLVKVGDLSMYMWFFHAIFFTDTVNLYTRQLVMEPIHCYLYTLIMTFILTYICSWLIKKALSPVMSKI